MNEITCKCFALAASPSASKMVCFGLVMNKKKHISKFQKEKQPSSSVYKASYEIQANRERESSIQLINMHQAEKKKGENGT